MPTWCAVESIDRLWWTDERREVRRERERGDWTRRQCCFVRVNPRQKRSIKQKETVEKLICEDFKESVVDIRVLWGLSVDVMLRLSYQWFMRQFAGVLTSTDCLANHSVLINHSNEWFWILAVVCYYTDNTVLCVLCVCSTYCLVRRRTCYRYHADNVNDDARSQQTRNYIFLFNLKVLLHLS